MNKLNFYMPKQQLNNAVETIVHTAKGVRSDIHRVAVACLLHAQEHGDLRPLNRLITGLKDTGAYRIKALCQSVKRHTPVMFDETEQRTRFHKPKDKRVWDIDAFIKHPFYSDTRNDGTAEGSKEWSQETYEKRVLKVLKDHGVNVVDFAEHLKKKAA